MKVGFCNKRLWSQFIKYVSAFSTILAFLMSFFDLDQCTRIKIGIGYLVFLIIFFIILLIRANKLQSMSLKINGTDINIVYGDIFKRPGIKVIAFNEFFDTAVDDRIISSKSLNGIYINKYSRGVDAINEAIAANSRLPANITEHNCERKFGGKTEKYRLGTICPVEDYYLLAFTHFDEDNKAYLTLEDYICCLMHMWYELDVYYSGKPVNITLLGSGITRFKNGDVSPQELLKTLIWSFKASKVKFNNTSSLNIVLDKRKRDEINLYEIGEEQQ